MDRPLPSTQESSDWGALANSMESEMRECRWNWRLSLRLPGRLFRTGGGPVNSRRLYQRVCVPCCRAFLPLYSVNPQEFLRFPSNQLSSTSPAVILTKSSWLDTPNSPCLSLSLSLRKIYYNIFDYVCYSDLNFFFCRCRCCFVWEENRLEMF